MVTKRATELPAGFGGAVESWTEFVQGLASAVVLPRDGEVRHGTFSLSAKCGDAQRIVIDALTESMGCPEGFLEGLAAASRPDAELVLEVENQQSVRSLRRVLEGKPGALDPEGKLVDPARDYSLSRILEALQAAGFLVEECVRVPGDPTEIATNFVESMFDQGFLPLGFLEGAPAWKHWIRARKGTAISGSVILAGGSAAQQQQTRQLVESFLPNDWEVIAGDGGEEAESFSGAIPRSRGEVLWFVRGGSVVTEDSFADLLAKSVLGPAVPAFGDDPVSPGDVGGLMIPRASVLRTGPISGRWSSSSLNYESWLLALDATGQAIVPAAVSADFSMPAPPSEGRDTFEGESKDLIAQWECVARGRHRHTSDDDPKGRTQRAAQDVPWVGRTPTVSLCMIAKDEEEFIGDCLAAARPFVDEIVLVDTGSTDRTMEIAREFGARILERPWDDDFATPRNLGLEAATGDWVLVLDADEVLEPAHGERIRDLVQDAGVCGYHMKFTNLYTGGKTLGVLMVRLFQRLPGVRYENRIHEQVTPSLVAMGRPKGLILSISDIEVVHKGYADEVMLSRNKNERNERLFRLQLEEHPDDVYNLYKYGDFLRRVPGRGRDARDRLEECLELILAAPPSAPRGMPFAGEVAALCALEFAREGLYERAEEILDAAFGRFVPTPNLHYIAASVAFYRQRYDESIAHYTSCLRYRDRTLVVPVQEGITSYVSMSGIAQCWIAKGEIARGRRLLEQAIRIHPSYEVSQLALSRLLLQEGDSGQALQVLTAYLAQFPESPGACHQATLILKALGMKDQARRMGHRAIELFEKGAMDHEANQMKELLVTL